MKFSILMAAGIPFYGAANAAAVHSGHATAELTGASSYAAGKAIPVGIRLKMEPGWHSYWVNPGDSGVPLKAVWTLPDGWKAGPLLQPVPKRFMTGDLPGFGYEGEATFVVSLTPPPSAAGAAELKVKLSWLTCNENACVPGDVDLTLKLAPGESGVGKGIDAALEKIPVTLTGSSLAVDEKEDGVHLRLTLPDGVDGTGLSAYPATAQVLDTGAKLDFTKDGPAWICTAKKNEYADGPLTKLELVLAGGKLPHPLTVTWEK
jgi:thiol:disulfide interchange protein DsbD